MSTDIIIENKQQRQTKNKFANKCNYYKFDVDFKSNIEMFILPLWATESCRSAHMIMTIKCDYALEMTLNWQR